MIDAGEPSNFSSSKTLIVGSRRLLRASLFFCFFLLIFFKIIIIGEILFTPLQFHYTPHITHIYLHPHLYNRVYKEMEGV